MSGKRDQKGDIRKEVEGERVGKMID